MSSDRLRIPEFYKLSIEERVRLVHERGLLNTTDFRALATGRHTLDLAAADKMIENVVGVMGLPLGLGTEPRRERQAIRRADGRRGAVGRRRAGLGVQARAQVRRLSRGSDGSDPDRPDPGREPARHGEGEARAARSQARDRQSREQLPPEHGRPRRRCSRHRAFRPSAAVEQQAACSSCTCSWTRATRWARTSSTRMCEGVAPLVEIDHRRRGVPANPVEPDRQVALRARSCRIPVEQLSRPRLHRQRRRATASSWPPTSPRSIRIAPPRTTRAS